jgi:RNA polymerase-binding protein DksA
MKQLLREQRRSYLRAFRTAEDALADLDAERESELEEHGQEQQLARLLTRLDDRTVHTVKEIDAALQRIVDGTYGTCEECAEPIAADRLRSLPASRYCISCAQRHESTQAPEH